MPAVRADPTPAAAAAAAAAVTGSPAARRPPPPVAQHGAARIPGIDGLRAVAILLVMASHAGLGHVVPGGFGVTVFFFLSGYLITTLLRLEWTRTGRIDLLAFYGRRAARILPPLFLTLALVVAMAGAGLVDWRPSGAELATHLLFLTNYAGLLGVPAAAPIPLWSLDVEEHFYLAFPALFLLLSVRAGHRLAAVFAALCAAVLLIRFATFPTGQQGNIYYWSHTRIDSILFGSILAVRNNPVLDERPWRPGAVHVGAALAVIGLTLAFRAPWFRETARYTLQGGALWVLFSAAIQSSGIVARVLDLRALRVVALLSYTLYLVHFPLLAATGRWGSVWSAPVAYLLAFAWAGLLYVAVERPLARWRKRSLRRAIAAAS